jgi:hypothetical protein
MYCHAKFLALFYPLFLEVSTVLKEVTLDWVQVTQTCILANEKAEIRRIAIQSQPRQIVQENLLENNPSQERAAGVPQGVCPDFQHTH